MYIRPSTEAGEVRDDLKRGSIHILNAPLKGDTSQSGVMMTTMLMTTMIVGRV